MFFCVQFLLVFLVYAHYQHSTLQLQPQNHTSCCFVPDPRWPVARNQKNTYILSLSLGLQAAIVDVIVDAAGPWLHLVALAVLRQLLLNHAQLGVQERPFMLQHCSLAAQTKPWIWWGAFGDRCHSSVGQMHLYLNLSAIWNIEKARGQGQECVRKRKPKQARTSLISALAV